MPIIEDTPSTPPLEHPVPLRVAVTPYRGVTVDSRYESITSLLTHMEGASWTINYYSQVLGLDNALSSQNLHRSPANQQYRCIIGLELKVTTPLNTTQDQATKEFNVTGQANLYPVGLIPNEGDCFIADVGDGREAVFEITSSEKRSIYRDAGFIVDYKIVAYSEQDLRINDLNLKTVEKLHYDKANAQNGFKALIHDDEYDLTKELRLAYEELIDFYFNRFTSQRFRMLLVPMQDFSVYDPMLTQAVLKMCRNANHPQIKHLWELNVAEDDNYLASTIWTTLLKRRRRDFINAIQQVGLVAVRQFSWDPMYRSVRYSGVDYVVYPVVRNKSEDYRRSDRSKTLSPWPIQTALTVTRDLMDLIQVQPLDGLPSFDAPAINPIDPNASYVFSPAFYANADSGQSALELAAQDYLDEKAVNQRLLFNLCRTYASWSDLDQYYQMPFLIAMVQACIGSY